MTIRTLSLSPVPPPILPTNDAPSCITTTGASEDDHSSPKTFLPPPNNMDQQNLQAMLAKLQEKERELAAREEFIEAQESLNQMMPDFKVTKVNSAGRNNPRMACPISRIMLES